jgi:formate/nitrite transporter FocA (FNT family)
MEHRLSIDFNLRRVWLAAVLGVIIGLGIAMSPRPMASQEKTMLQLTGVDQPQPARLEATSQAATDPLQYVLLGILAGIIVAMPVFVLSRRRYR